MTVLRLGPVSAIIRPRTAIVTVAAGVIALGLAIVSLGIGDFSLTPAQVLQVLLGAGTAREELIVTTLRLPRAALALVVGAALGVSGAIVQTTARNALASPDLLGITSGASAGAVAVIVLGGSGGQAAGLLRSVGVPVAAVLGGLGAAAVVALILRVVDANGVQPLLVGVGVSAFFGGLVSWMMIAASIDDAARANVWLTGTLNGRGWTELWVLTVVTGVALLVVVPASARLMPLALGADVARGLGVRLGPSLAVLLLVAVALASTTTAMLGPIAFVALVCPHLARLACGAARPPLAASAALGALLLTVADLAARSAIPSVQVPAGAITALIGAPFLLWLLVHTRSEAPR